MTEIKDIFARPSSRFPGAYDLLHVSDGAVVSRLHVSPTVYPVVDVDEDGPVTGVTGAGYDHPEGIVLTAEDVSRLGIEID